MKIAIRADASNQIGTGHIMRCLTLAEELRLRGADVCFICREFSGEAESLIGKKSFELHKLDNGKTICASKQSDVPHAEWLGVSWREDAEQTKEKIECYKIDWLIVDHYGLDASWHRELRSSVRKILVIDDLADRKLDCDVLLDQNLFKNMTDRYKGLVPSECEQLLGPGYALLRSEFKKARKTIGARTRGVEEITVFFGGADVINETTKVVSVLNKMDLKEIRVNVVVGVANQNRKYISELCKANKYFSYYEQISNIAELYARSDLCLGAGGVSTWERCALLLPAIVVAVAYNQIEICEAAYLKGLIKYLGEVEQVSNFDWEKAVDDMIVESSRLMEMSKSCSSYVDCSGVERVAVKLLSS